MIWFELLVCAATILIAGIKLSAYGDQIADRTGLGRTWIGLILLATVTSLPELISGVSAITVTDLPDVAVGGVLGSCLFNLVILAMLDLAAGKTPLSNRIHHSHVISAGFGISLLAVVCVSKIFAGPSLQIGWVDPFSIVYLLVYATAMRTIFQFESKRQIAMLQEATTEAASAGTLTRPVLLFIFFAALIVIASLRLPALAEAIGQATGLSNTFMGNSVVAITTSLPEVVVSLSAARMGAFDMAVGNVLGSNLFNIMILGVEDVCYIKGSLLANSSQLHVLSSLGAIICTAIAVIGVTFRAERKAFAVTSDSLLIVACYLAISYWIFISK
jgi:cation:H+ antiporter